MAWHFRQASQSGSDIYALKDDTVLEGLNANYFDDLFCARTDSFRAKSRESHDKFEMKDEEEHRFVRRLQDIW